MERPSGPTILVVEDDPSTRSALARDLQARGFRVETASDARSALAHWAMRRPDLVLLDLGLPDFDGSQVIRAVRREANTPIIVLSVRGEEATKVAALEAGADDYVTKPVGMPELNARVRAALRRGTGPAGDTHGRLVSGDLVLDPVRHEVRIAGRRLDLTPREFELLRVLMERAGRVTTRARLLRAVWGDAYRTEGHYLHVYVSQLRHKIAAADPGGSLHDLIVTEPGVGYRLRD